MKSNQKARNNAGFKGHFQSVVALTFSTPRTRTSNIPLKPYLAAIESLALNSTFRLAPFSIRIKAAYVFDDEFTKLVKNLNNTHNPSHRISHRQRPNLVIQHIRLSFRQLRIFQDSVRFWSHELCDRLANDAFVL